jgi:uncharacterized protein with HEPN domain
MLRREIGKYLYDVSSACDLIAVFVDGKTFEDYRSDAQICGRAPV